MAAANGRAAKRPRTDAAGKEEDAAAPDAAAAEEQEPEQEVRRICPYLSSINRNVLDFDFEKVPAFFTLSGQSDGPVV